MSVNTLAATPALDRVLRPEPLVIAHRGASRSAPENTLPSFRLALAARADLVELDYHLSADQAPVVIHDGTLDRTTDATNRWGGKKIAVASRKTAELATLDAGSWFGAAFAGTPLPTLPQALDVIQAGGCTLIERKHGDPTSLLRLLRERNELEHVVVQSFDWTFVREIKALAPTLVVGALGPPSTRAGKELSDEAKHLSPAWIKEVKELGALLVVWNRQVSAEAVGFAHAQGLKVWVYTIDDPEEAAQLVRWGVDGIISNDPVRLRARLKPQADEREEPLASRSLPRPMPDHPGNIFVSGESVEVRLPASLPDAEVAWRLFDDQHLKVQSGRLAPTGADRPTRLKVGTLGVGWYRLEFGPEGESGLPWTTAAVVAALRAPVPADSPIGVDSAAAWFARNDPPKQKVLANLAALAVVNWVRDRLRWADVQPEPGSLTSQTTTYDTSAQAQHDAGLKVLQVFHDTPRWARETADAGGRFAPDLRHVYQLAQALARRFQGRVQAWEPWNEGNIATFGAHTLDQMCSWQKAAYLGFKAGDPELIVGWNVSAAIPTPAQTHGVLANATWPYFDTYNIHSYDWSHGYAELWQPAREATSGRPLWLTEVDRGTKHLNNPPWYDQDPRLERLKAEWLAQSYASSLFAGTRRHFHFILGAYHEPNGVQFGLLRIDETPRPAYAALAAVGRCLAGARTLGRWRPETNIFVYAFAARPDGVSRDVLVVYTEKDVDWDERGMAQSAWKLPSHLQVEGVVDYLGRSLAGIPAPLTSRPVFVFLPSGQASTLPLEPPPALPGSQPGEACPIVLQLSLPTGATKRMEDVPWSESYAYTVREDTPLELPLRVYNFSGSPATGQLELESSPAGWSCSLSDARFAVGPGERQSLTGTLRVPAGVRDRDGWVVLRARGDFNGPSSLAFRVKVMDR